MELVCIHNYYLNTNALSTVQHAIKVIITIDLYEISTKQIN
jgi:hypothetical protein